MIEGKDLEQIKEKGITEDQIEWQLKTFREGVPYMKLNRAATIDDGIIRIDKAGEYKLSRLYDEADSKSKIKFVPASGAASRMFKTLFEFLDSNVSSGDSGGAIETFIHQIDKFAFIDDLREALTRMGKTLESCLESGDYRCIVKALLNEEGLGYGSLPKGLLKFHNYEDHSRTPFEEHLMEAARYARSVEGHARLHFTVSPEHMQGFKDLMNKVSEIYKEKFKTDFEVSFSVQKPSTDTLAVGHDNKPFRNPDDSILFRPGGHGALIYNLNELDQDLIFIKNIDNVVPEKYAEPTIRYKKILAGKLLEVQGEVFSLLDELEGGSPESGRLEEIYNYIRKELCYEPKHAPDFHNTEAAAEELRSILDRPVRVCGVVKNLGEPGGGPFWAPNSKGDISLQIIESSQIDADDNTQMEIFSKATHFNPVDLLCSPKDRKGNKFDLTRFIDPGTCFISHKSKDGKELKALELPGLWNGAMADWITLFVEVPIETFNPVKTVNDLLREKHQN